MGFRFRRSVRLFPGVRLNIGKRGISATIGQPGASLNIGKHGARATVGIPGTGLSYTTRLGGSRHGVQQVTSGRQGVPRRSPALPMGHGAPQPPTPLPLPAGPKKQAAYIQHMQAAPMRQIASASVETLTSSGLEDVRSMLADARTQRSEIESELDEATRENGALTRELERKRRGVFRVFFRKRVTAIEAMLSDLAGDIAELHGVLAKTQLEMAFDIGPDAQQVYGALVRAFEALRQSAAIWDVAAARATNRAVERTTAVRTIDRKPVTFDFAQDDIVRFPGRAMRLGNANGEDILIYPGVIVMPRPDGAFALLDIREVNLAGTASGFIESDSVPKDAQVVSHTWARANKDGSPDRRFSDNYQIPVCRYGRLEFASPSGMREEYQVSNADAALAFASAYSAFRTALSA